MTHVRKHLTLNKQKQAYASSKVKAASCLGRMCVNSRVSALLIKHMCQQMCKKLYAINTL